MHECNTDILVLAKSLVHIPLVYFVSLNGLFYSSSSAAVCPSLIPSVTFCHILNSEELCDLETFQLKEAHTSNYTKVS